MTGAHDGWPKRGAGALVCTTYCRAGRARELVSAGEDEAKLLSQACADRQRRRAEQFARARSCVAAVKGRHSP